MDKNLLFDAAFNDDDPTKLLRITLLPLHYSCLNTKIKYDSSIKQLILVSTFVSVKNNNRLCVLHT